MIGFRGHLVLVTFVEKGAHCADIHIIRTAIF